MVSHPSIAIEKGPEIVVAIDESTRNSEIAESKAVEIMSTYIGKC